MERARIMVVEDEVIVASDIRASLEDMGYSVCSMATSGEEAIEKAQKNRPDLILMDIVLGGKTDGIEAASEIRRHLNLPVIYLTAYSSDEIMERAKHTEPSGYLIKPFDDREMRAAIEMGLYKARMEKKLRDSEAHFRTMLESSYDWESWLAPDGRYLCISPSCERITGYPPDAFLKDPHLLEKITHQDDRRHFVNHMGGDLSPESEEANDFEFRIRHKNGEERRLFHNCQPLYDAEGMWMGRRSSNRDITEKHKLEEELEKTKKLEATGILAGGIAHDFNNLLTVIQGNVELAQMSMAPENDASEFLSNALGGCARIKSLTEKFITFAKGGSPVKETVRVSKLIRDAITLGLSGTNVSQECHIPDDLWQIEADPRQISQALHNVIENAKQAMPEGGRIQIRAENIGKRATHQITYLPEKDAEYVRIDIRDQGSGIPREHLDKIFVPYFSTKERGYQKGMGLGLSIVHSVITRHRGCVHLESGPGEGTTVYMYLPASRKSETELSVKKREVCHSDIGKKRILVMDDEELVRSIIEQMLSHIGHEAVFTKHGDEASEQYANALREGRRFDLLILDLTIKGGKGGKDTIREILAMDSDAKAIVSSGYSNDPVMSDFRTSGFVGSLAKPYQLKELNAALNEVFQSHAEG